MPELIFKLWGAHAYSWTSYSLRPENLFIMIVHAGTVVSSQIDWAVIEKSHFKDTNIKSICRWPEVASDVTSGVDDVC